MSSLAHFLAQHGYAVVFAFVLVEQIGLPVPAVPMLLAAGAFAGQGRISLSLAIVTAVCAAVAGDLFWYTLGRRNGRSVLGWVCRISLEPDSCVRRTQDSFQNYGAGLLLFAKFVPGLSTAAPSLAAIVKMPLLKFVAWDLGGSIVWAGSFVGIGYLFRTQLEDVALIVGRLGAGILTLLAGGFVLFLLFKFAQRRMFLRMIAVNRIAPAELMLRLTRGEQVIIADLRHQLDLQLDPVKIPGAVQFAPEELAQRHMDFPRDREIVLYCSCPSEATSAHMALELRHRGITRVRPLQGGFEAWRRSGFPVESISATERSTSSRPM